jgi:hypothetical protein
MFENLETVFYRQIYQNMKKFKTIKRTSAPAQGSTLLACAGDLANSLFHFREHFSAHQQLTRAEVELVCPAFEIVGDVANVIKHGRLTSSTPHGTPHVRLATVLKELDVLIGYLDQEGPYWHSEKCISLTKSTGERTELDNSLVEVYNFWQQKLVETGINQFPSFKRFAPIGSRFVARDKARLGRIEVMQGLPFSGAAQILIFDPLLSVAVPFPLARNINDFLKRTLKIGIVFEDNETETIHLDEYKPPDENTLSTLLESLDATEIAQLPAILSRYGIDIWDIVRAKFGTKANGRNAKFEFQVMQHLTVPSGSVVVRRKPKR